MTPTGLSKLGERVLQAMMSALRRTPASELHATTSTRLRSFTN